MPRRQNAEQRANFRSVLSERLDTAPGQTAHTPEGVAWAAWEPHGLLRKDETPQSLNLNNYKLSPSEARDALARKRYVAVIEWLVDNEVITEISQANDLLDLIESEYKGAANPAYGELNEVQQALSNYDKDWRNLESALWDRLRAKEREAKIPAGSRPRCVRRDDALARLKQKIKDSTGIVYIAEPEGAGKSELVRQLIEDWSDPKATGLPVVRFDDGEDSFRFITIDLENRELSPMDLAGLVYLAAASLDPGAPHPHTLPEGCANLVRTILGVRARQLAEQRATGKAVDKELIVVNNARPADLVRTRQLADQRATGEVVVKELIVVDNARRADLIRTLDQAIDTIEDSVVHADAPDGPVRVKTEFVILVTCRRKLQPALHDAEGRRFRSITLTKPEALRILARGLGALDEGTKTTLSGIAATLDHWPSVLDAVNRKLDQLAGRSTTISDLARNLQGHLAAHAARLRETLDTPNARIELINAFTGAAPDDPSARFLVRRSAYLVEDARSLDYDLNRQFVSLTISLPGSGALPATADSLSEALRLVAERDTKEQVFVLTAPPGAGKSTLFRRLEWEMVNGRLAPGEGPPPLVLFVPLNAVEPPGADPWLWLHHTWWPQHQGDLPSLVDVMAGRPVWLLLDAANELKRPSGETIDQRMRVWASRARQLIPGNPAHRVIFSCRERDAGSVFRDARAVEIGAKALNDAQMSEFLGHYLANASPQQVQAELRRTRALDGRPDNLFRLPLWLKLLADDFNARGPAGLSQLPRNRAGLVSSLLRRRLIAERAKGTGPLAVGPRLVTQGQWRQIDAGSNHFLAPHGGVLMPGLEKLALRMMAEGTTLDVRAATAAIGADAPAVLGCAQKALDLIRCEDVDLAEPVDNDWAPNTTPSLAFTHQQFQEYFAGRAIARTGRIDPDLIRPAFDEIGPWDEAVLFAAAMVPDEKLAGFINAVRQVNLPLAARCAGQPHVCPTLEKEAQDFLPTLRAALPTRLAVTTGTAFAERNACAAALFDAGHPDFEEAKAEFDGKVIRFALPKKHAQIPVPAGDYWLGAEDLNTEDYPRHLHYVEPGFLIAKYPVTNYEFAFFIDAGGYDDSRWWNDSAAARLRQASGTTKETIDSRWSVVYRWRTMEPTSFRRELSRLPESMKLVADFYREADESQLARFILGDLKDNQGSLWPRHWADPKHNGLGQPVVGVDFYEARAYATWLNQMCASSGRSLRSNLPNEDQWEAAASGFVGRRWAAELSHFDGSLYNTSDTETNQRVGMSSVVGAFEGGATPEGVHDMCGNVFEWTLSEFVIGRERDWRPENRNDVGRQVNFRVVRGGSWLTDRTFSRCAYRGRISPLSREAYVGFRLIFSSEWRKRR